MMHKINAIACFLILVFAISVFIACSPATRKKSLSTREETSFELKPGAGDAYLYDVKININGKKRSTRLDVYAKPDTIALFARAYLGKGMLKAVIIRDSALVYFPTEDEYFHGRLYDLVDDQCVNELWFERILIDLFQMIPVDLDYDTSGFYVVVLEESKSICRYRIESRMCHKALEISYEFRDNRYIPDVIEYSHKDGSINILAKKRTQSLNIDIPPEKMTLDIPVSASRIIP